MINSYLKEPALTSYLLPITLLLSEVEVLPITYYLLPIPPMIRIQTVNYSEHLTEIKAIRYQVFELEQGINPELEFDGEDELAQHLLAYLDDYPIGTLRIRYLDPEKAKIERLAVLASARGMGIGQQLMECALEAIAQTSITIVIVNAQTYIKNLYLKLGFEAIGEPFQEAEIAHIKMIKYLGNRE